MPARWLVGTFCEPANGLAFRLVLDITAYSAALAACQKGALG